MSDLAVLAGFAKPKASSGSYHLQEMGIDVWKLRQVEASQVLVLVINQANTETLSKQESRLLNNMLASTNLDKEIFDVEHVTNIAALTGKNLRKYAAVVIFGDDNHDSMFNGLPLYNILHPKSLLGNTNDKRIAYLSLHKLRWLFN